MPRKLRVVIRRAKVGAGTHSISDHGRLLLEAIDQLRAVAIVDVDHGRGVRLRLLSGEPGEELRFRLEIILHRPVKIEMVLGQVGEDGDIPFEPARSVLRDGVRRHFHRGGLATRVHHLREEFLDIERLRRRADRRQNAIADFIANGPEQSAAQARFLANVFEQERRGGLAVGPGDRGQLEPAHGPFVKGRAEIGEGVARVLDHEAGRARLLNLLLRHDDRGAFFDGLLDELVAIAFFAAQCDEKKVPLHTPRVIRDAFHDAIKRPDDLAGGNRGGENFELHEMAKGGRKTLNGVAALVKATRPATGGFPASSCGSRSR